MLKRGLFFWLALAGGLAAQEPRPAVIAHRGASGYLPEHTLAALALAHGQGADFIEQDLVLTKDDVPVVLHDIHLDTVTDVAGKFPGRQRADGRYYAIDFTLAEIKQLEVFERFDRRTGRPVYPGRFPAGPAGLRIPTLEEELRLLAGLNRSTGRQAGIYPELKEPRWHREQGRDLSGIVLPILARHGYATKADACWLQCFDWAEVRRLRDKLGWRGRLVLLLEGADTDDAAAGFGLTPAGLAELAKTVDGIGPPISRLISWDEAGQRRPADLARVARAAGLAVHPYTVRADALPAHCPSLDELHAALFGEARVDGVFTDFPALTLGWLERNGPPPAAR